MFPDACCRVAREHGAAAAAAGAGRGLGDRASRHARRWDDPLAYSCAQLLDQHMQVVFAN